MSLAHALLTIGAAVLVACGAAGPRLDGPPRVLQLHATSVVLGWRLWPPAVGCELALQGPSGRIFVRSAPALEHRTTVRELEAGVEHAYAIQCGDRALFEGGFRTAPASGTGFTFAVLGDSGTASREQRRLADRIASVAPDFVLHTGDVLYLDDERDAFLDPYRALLPRVPFWVALGNHDVSRAEQWTGLFDLPRNGPRRGGSEWSYFFDFGDARVAVVDSNGGQKALGGRVAPWLRDVFARAPAPRWRFVAMHHPSYTWGKHSPHIRAREYLVPLFEELGVDVVFSGHDHNYQRTAPLRAGRPASGDERGVVYLVTGAGGARLYEVAPRATWPDALRAADGERHSFTHVLVSQDRIEGEQIDLDGELLDRWKLEAHDAEPGLTARASPGGR